MTSTPREIGTLIVVILKAKNLPNKRHIGKQDPYCAVEFNQDRRRSKTVRKGGQHPEWDEEIRFTLLEDYDDDPAPSPMASGSPPPPPPKKITSGKIKGGNKMWIACFADDPKEPELIGEANVDLTEVLTKGETDEWFTIMSKDKYCGEVYLELTFWSNDKPPEKRHTPQASVSNPNYGGPGSFIPNNNHNKSRSGSESDQIPSPSRVHGSNTSLPNALRASGSLAQIDLYTPPYERQDRIENRDPYDIGGMTSSMAELGVRRQASFPPLNGVDPFRGPEIDAHIQSLPTYGGYEGFRPVSSMSVAPSVNSFPNSDSYGSRLSAFSSGYSSPYQDDSYQRYPQYYPPALGQEPPWANPNPPGPSEYFVNPTPTPIPSHFTNGRPLPTASSFMQPVLNTGMQPHMPRFEPQSSFATPVAPFPQTFPPVSTTPAPYTHFAPAPPASAPPGQPYIPPGTPLSVPPMSTSAPPPPPVSAFPSRSPERTPPPTHLLYPSPPSTNSRPLPDPYNSSSQSQVGPPPPLNSSQGPGGRPPLPIPGPPPPLPGRRSSLPFPPPPPPPSIPIATFPSPTGPTPSSSFDFSAVPPPPSMRNNGLVPPPPPPQLGRSSSLTVPGSQIGLPVSPNSTMYSVPPPPPPPTRYETGVRY